jgi:hypothetical protein
MYCVNTDIRQYRIICTGHDKSQLLIIYAAFVKYKWEWEYNETMHQLFIIDFKKVCDSVRREVLYNLIEFGISMKLVRLIKMCLNETHSRVWGGKHLSDMFPIKNGLKQDVLLPLLRGLPLGGIK